MAEVRKEGQGDVRRKQREQGKDPMEENIREQGKREKSFHDII